MAVHTGERAITAEAGFNPAWQRHVAEYVLVEPFLRPGRVLDVGCGIGHSYDRLGGRETVGVDVEASALEGQRRETHVADMRDLPFPARSFENAVSMHSIEHVPDPERALAEIARVLTDDGVAVVATPNRLTFARPDEIIDPYHFVELDPEQLATLCRDAFDSVSMAGVFGSERYGRIVAREHAKLDALLRKDPLRLRRFVPRRARAKLYDWRLSAERAEADEDQRAITEADFTLGTTELDACLDVVAVLRAPRRR